MSQSGAQTAVFFRDVVRTGAVWTVRDAGGIAALVTESGRRAMPFWSSETRVQRIIATVPAYGGFEPVRIDLDAWRVRWVPGCGRDGLLLGINWSGPRATGWDLEAVHVLARLAEAAGQAQRTGAVGHAGTGAELRYLRVRWLHDLAEEPVLLYSEFDEGGWEIRKVEIYRDGRHDYYADASASTGTSVLSIEPLPDIAEIAARDEFDPYLITRGEFEPVWAAATGRSRR